MASNQDKATVERVESVGDGKGGDKQFDYAADEATTAEHSLTVMEAFKTYPMAVVWSVLFCLCVVMDGYDSNLITNLYGLPSFQLKYGVVFEGSYTIPAAWQTALAMSSPVGRVVGGGIQGYVAEMFGRKRTLIGCLVLITGFIFITFFAHSLTVLLVGEMLCGIIWGVLTSLAPIYASEVAPLKLRDLLTAYINMCWSIGQLIATAVLAGMAPNPTEWSYRIPFALQWLWPVLIFSFIYWAPESPYWLVRHGKLDKAESALRQLISSRTDRVDVKNMLALIQRTNEREQEMASSVRYVDCFRGVDLRRTVICSMAWGTQILSGLSLPFFAVVFFQQAGFPATQAFNLNVGMTGLGFVGTLCSFFLIPRVGRRTLYVGGLSVLTALMLLIGFLGIPAGSAKMNNAIAALLLIWFFLYYLTVGPLAYVIVSETSSTRLRGHTTAIALIAYSLLGIVYNISSPYLINASEVGLGAKTGLIYGGVSLLALVWCFFNIPECKGRTFEEIDIMFERKVPTRQFKSYVI
ncbi:related to maltose permease [Cephalotrichum gorgonifer]|uniref:Related to maltose permease n=1 Tax=Cephalotrichum gorgonifer TaxID=2041049 RepID=A0AAE8SW09_9PEZI|nr:related to maltose permease [Cephalotrichum gorgonifer]